MSPCRRVDKPISVQKKRKSEISCGATCFIWHIYAYGPLDRLPAHFRICIGRSGCRGALFMLPHYGLWLFLACCPITTRPKKRIAD
jgi:hypothetical protein